MQRLDHVPVHVVVTGKTPTRTEARGVPGDVHDVAEERNAEGDGDLAPRQLGDSGVVKGSEDDVLPVNDMFQELVFPLRALYLQDHHRAFRIGAQLAKPLHDDSPLVQIDRGQGLDLVVDKLVVVVQDGRPVGEQPEVRLEAVGTLSDGLVERRQSVLREASRTAAMTEDQEAVGDRNLLSCRN